MLNETTVQEIRKFNKLDSQKQSLLFERLVDRVSIYAPATVPLIPASLTTISIANSWPNLFHIHPIAGWILGLIAGIGIEVLGIVSVDSYFNMRYFNQTKIRDNDDGPDAPASASKWVVIFYGMVVLTVVFLLKIFPNLAVYSLIPLCLMGILVCFMVVLRKQFNELVYQREEKKIRHDMMQMLNNTIAQLQNELKCALENIAQLQNKNAQYLEENAQLQNAHLSSAQLLENAHSKIAHLENLNAQLEQKYAHFESENAHTKSAHTQMSRMRTPNSENFIKENAQRSEQKNKKLKEFAHYLSENFDGMRTDDLNISEIAKFNKIHRKTVQRYLDELHTADIINGSIDATLISQFVNS